MAARREQILQAARRTIERLGVVDAAISHIAAEAGLSVGSIYVHFRSREAILTELIRRNDVGPHLFEQAGEATAMLDQLAELLRVMDGGTDSPAGRVTLEIAALARRSESMHAAVRDNYTQAQQAVVAAAVRLAAARGSMTRAQAATVGECLFSLLLAAQFAVIAGMPADTAERHKAARLLLEMLHGGPVRTARR